MKNLPVCIDSQCYLCHFRKKVEFARSLGDEETATAFARELLQLYLSAPEGVSSPWLGPHTTALLDKYYHLGADPFLEEKKLSNTFVLQRLDTIRKNIQAASDPVFTALQYSVLGNYIDYSALQGEVNLNVFEEMLHTAETISLDKEIYLAFCRDLEKSKKLLYLTDNAGEIGFDRLLAEELQKHYPQLSITFCVRGGPAQNDATREDAAFMGISFPVIDNGNTVAGTQLDMLSEEALAAMEEADIILSKGQGNAETLLGTGYNIYYAFLIKCQRFIRLFQKEKLTPMFIHEEKDRVLQ